MRRESSFRVVLFDDADLLDAMRAFIRKTRLETSVSGLASMLLRNAMGLAPKPEHVCEREWNAEVGIDQDCEEGERTVELREDINQTCERVWSPEVGVARAWDGRVG